MNAIKNPSLCFTSELRSWSRYSSTTLWRHGEKSVHRMPDAMTINPEYRHVSDAFDYAELLVLIGQLVKELEQLRVCRVSVVLGSRHADRTLNFFRIHHGHMNCHVQVSAVWRAIGQFQFVIPQCLGDSR